jgi:hypothetical protein
MVEARISRHPIGVVEVGPGYKPDSFASFDGCYNPRILTLFCFL